MIERYVYLRFKDEYSNEASRAEAAAACRELLPQVPGVVSATVGLPGDAECEAKWDLALVVRFNSIDDVEAYRVHPTHMKLVTEVLRPRMKVIKAWNFDIGE